MPHFKGTAPLSIVQLPIQHQRAPDAAPDIHVAKCFRALTRSTAILAPTRRIGIIRDHRRQAKLLLEPRLHLHRVPPAYLMRGEDAPRSTFHRATKAHADTRNRRALALSPNQKRGNMLLHPTQNRRRIARLRDSPRFNTHNLARVRTHGNLQFRTANFNT